MIYSLAGEVRHGNRVIESQVPCQIFVQGPVEHKEGVDNDYSFLSPQVCVLIVSLLPMCNLELCESQFSHFQIRLSIPTYSFCEFQIKKYLKKFCKPCRLVVMMIIFLPRHTSITMPWVFPGDNQVIIVTCTLKHMQISWGLQPFPGKICKRKLLFPFR